jgi:hypothetical protein
MEQDSSLSCTQDTVICPYPEANEYWPHPPAPFVTYIVITPSPHLPMDLAGGFFPSGFPTSFLPYEAHVQSIVFSKMLSTF